MAKRKKSKKPAKSEASTAAQAPETSEIAGAETEATDAEEVLVSEESAAVSAESEPTADAGETLPVAEDAAEAPAADAEPVATDTAAEVALEAPAVAIESKRKRGKSRKTGKNGDKGTAAAEAESRDTSNDANSASEEQATPGPNSETVAEAADEASTEAADEASTEAAEVVAASTNPTDVDSDQSADSEDSGVWPAADDAAAGTTNADPDAETYDNAWATDAGADAGGEASVADAADSADGDQPAEKLSDERLEAVIESLLFASDKALGLSELKRLIGEKDGKKVSAAVERLIERRKGTGIEVIAMSTGWHLRTSAENADWVGKLLVGKPVRLSRAMLETLAIVAYRQPVTRPEVDDIRGVDCGAVLKTLLDRGLIRIIGKKEEVGRPMLYGTTPEFLRIFNLQDLSELPTLREFYDLSAEDQSKVEAEHGPAPTPSATTAKPDVAMTAVSRGALAPEPEDTDPLLDELDEASQLAKKALGDLDPPAAEAEAAPATGDASDKADKDSSPPAAE